MTDDIVKRLRERESDLAHEAADLIEGLRERIGQLRRNLARKRTRGGSDPEVGGFRSSDPETSKKAARSINITYLRYCALLSLDGGKPLNNSEMADELNAREIHGTKWERDTISPRMTDLRNAGLVKIVGERPGPTGHPQDAYVLTELGRQQLAAIREPPKPRGKKKGPE